MEIWQDIYYTFVQKPMKNRVAATLENWYFAIKFYIEDNPQVYEYIVLAIFFIVIFVSIIYVCSCFTCSLRNMFPSKNQLVTGIYKCQKKASCYCVECMDKVKMAKNENFATIKNKLQTMRNTFIVKAAGLLSLNFADIPPLSESQIDNLIKSSKIPTNTELLGLSKSLLIKINDDKKEPVASAEWCDAMPENDLQKATKIPIRRRCVCRDGLTKSGLPTWKENPACEETVNTEVPNKKGTTLDRTRKAVKVGVSPVRPTATSRLNANANATSATVRTEENRRTPTTPTKSRLDQILATPVHKQPITRRYTVSKP